MIKKILLFTTAIGLLVVTGCSDDGVNPPGPSKSDNPVLEASAGNLDFQAGHLSETVVISNTGTGVLQWQTELNADWLSVSGSSGSLGPGDTRIRLHCNPTGLDFGTYSAQLTVRSGDQSRDFQVSLDHSEAELRLGMPILMFDRAHLTHEITLLNLGTSNIEFEITAVPEWIRIDTTAGRFFEGPARVGCLADPTDMTYGEYTGEIDIVSAAGDQTVAVLFTYERMIEVFPGLAAARILLGDTVSEIQSRYGEPDWMGYDQQPDRSLIHRIMYYDMGLTIYFRSDLLQLHPNKRNSGILVEDPYDGITEEFLGIGSPLDSVVAVYGNPDSLALDGSYAKYETGIGFGLDETGTVINMRIF